MQVWSSLRAQPTPVRIALGATLVNRAGSMALPFLVVYLVQERGFAAERAGLVLAAYGAGSLASGLMGGWLVSRAGARAVMVLSLLGGAAAMLAVVTLVGLEAVIAVTFGWALIGESFRPACAAVIVEHVPAAERRSAFALLRFAVNLGMTIGPAIGGLLAERSFFALFAVDAGTSVLAAGLLALPASAGVGAPAAEARGAEKEGSLHTGPLIRHLGGVLLVAMVAYQGLSTLAVFMTGPLGLSPAIYGGVFALNGALIVGFEVSLTQRLATHSHRRLLVAGATLTAVGFGLLALAHGLVGVIACTLVFTVGEMTLGPASLARAAELEPAHRRGIYIGLHSAMWSCGFALGPWLGMKSYATFDQAGHWLLVAIVGMIAAALFLVTDAPGPQRES